MIDAALPPCQRQILVVFEHREDMLSLRWLRPGFRHCFCLIEAEGRWIVVDPLKNRTCIELVPPHSIELIVQTYAARGATTLIGELSPPEYRGLRLRVLTCVEVIKTVLGISELLTWTPYQLFRTLIENHKFCVVLPEAAGLESPGITLDDEQ